MAKIPTLVTERLLLRPFQREDAARIEELANDRAIADTYSELPYPFGSDLAEKWIGTHQDSFERGAALILAITRKPEGELIGGVGLQLTPFHKSAEIGYWIGKPYWNNGYATEASKSVLEYAFEKMELHRIQARHMARNPASGRVLEKAGMKYEGTLRQSLFRWDKFEDADIYSILRNEFTAGD